MTGIQLMECGRPDRLLPKGQHELSADEVREMFVDAFPDSYAHEHLRVVASIRNATAHDRSRERGVRRRELCNIAPRPARR